MSVVNLAPTSALSGCMKMLVLLALLLSQLPAMEEEIALINFATLDQYGELLLLRTDHGRELMAKKTEVQKKDDAEKRKSGTTTSPYLAEVCALNAATDAEKRVLLSSYVKQALGDRYVIVITDSSCLMSKKAGMKIVDVSLDVIEAINADKTLMK
jgi:hypothetical protein